MAAMRYIKLFRNVNGIVQLLKTTIRLHHPGRSTETKTLTLTGRIAMFIDTQYNKPKIIEKNNNLTDRCTSDADIYQNPTKQMTNELQNLVKNLEDKLSKNQQQFANLFHTIDSECCSRLQCLDIKGILGVLNYLMHLNLSHLTRYRVYEHSLQKLLENIVYLSRDELLQLIFYIGLKKDESAQGMLKKCLQVLHKYEISDLSVEEMCIVCNSTFRTSTRIRSQKILAQIHRILSEKLFILQDPALFVTFIKSIRHNREQTSDLLSTISCAIFFNRTYTKYSFTAICHILALFADYAYYDEELLKLMTSLGVEEIKKMSTRSYELRNKDVTRFMWSLSMLYYCNDVVVEMLISIIEDKVARGHYRDDIEELVNTILSFWILKHQPIGLIKYALTYKNIALIKGIKSRTKLRMYLLISCIYLENKALYKTLNLKNETFKIYNLQQQIERRPVLCRVFDALKVISQCQPINYFQITYEIPHLNICGITGYKKKIYKSIYIEVLDDYVTVKNQDCWPNGPMRLKLRLLEQFDEDVILIDASSIEEMTEKDLEGYLKDKIKSLC